MSIHPRIFAIATQGSLCETYQHDLENMKDKLNKTHREGQC
jgi:hypothetical protein